MYICISFIIYVFTIVLRLVLGLILFWKYSNTESHSHLLKLFKLETVAHSVALDGLELAISLLQFSKQLGLWLPDQSVLLASEPSFQFPLPYL